MKKIIFISLLVIPFCKAADDANSYERWDRAVREKHSNYNRRKLNFITNLSLLDSHIPAIPDNPNLPHLTYLNLRDNQIAAIPEKLNLRKLEYLNLQDNDIESVNPQILQQLPSLRFLYLNKNPLTQANVDKLKEAAEAEAHRKITIIADDTGDQYRNVDTKEPPRSISIILSNERKITQKIDANLINQSRVLKSLSIDPSGNYVYHVQDPEIIDAHVFQLIRLLEFAQNNDPYRKDFTNLFKVRNNFTEKFPKALVRPDMYAEHLRIAKEFKIKKLEYFLNNFDHRL